MPDAVGRHAMFDGQDVGPGVALWLRTDDAPAPHDEPATAGVPVADGPFGKHSAFADPEGYVITVHDGE
ncbi:VOC family protein [Nocardia wallacei]|uniref:VOC family protein n=1 Tax=Nocardia wallacei TaxID=480035 RepID=UPI00245829B2|nr:hypothetical protein [Nocardia wallacei]